MHARTTPNARKGTPVKAPSRADGRPSLSTSIVIIGTRRCTYSSERMWDLESVDGPHSPQSPMLMRLYREYFRMRLLFRFPTCRWDGWRAGYLGNNINQILESKSLLLTYIIRLPELGHAQPVMHAVKFESAEYEMIVARPCELS